MTDPDYTVLALRLGDAADLLEEVSKIYGYEHPEVVMWSPSQLRREAEEL